MSYRVRFTEETENDLVRLYEFALVRDEAGGALAEHVLEAMKNGLRSLGLTPFSFRKAMPNNPNNPFLREIVIPFGASGYVALYEIDDEKTITILAVRHQREDDYH